MTRQMIGGWVPGEQLEVIVVDDHLAMRRGIELLLREAGFRIAGVAGSLDEARAVLSRRRFDVALLDVQLGRAQLARAARGAAARRPGGADRPLHRAHAARTRRCTRRSGPGARGFVLKSSAAPRLTDALRAVAAGGTYVDPGAGGGQLAEGGELQRLGSLSPRELEVLELLADGLNGQLIAERLFLSPETVRTHVRNATSKLGARTRVQAVALVVRGRGAS